MSERTTLPLSIKPGATLKTLANEEVDAISYLLEEAQLRGGRAVRHGDDKSSSWTAKFRTENDLIQFMMAGGKELGEQFPAKKF